MEVRADWERGTWAAEWAGADPTKGCDADGGRGGNRDLDGMASPCEDALMLSTLFLNGPSSTAC